MILGPFPRCIQFHAQTQPAWGPGKYAKMIKHPQRETGPSLPVGTMLKRYESTTSPLAPSRHQTAENSGLWNSCSYPLLALLYYARPERPEPLSTIPPYQSLQYVGHDSHLCSPAVVGVTFPIMHIIIHNIDASASLCTFQFPPFSLSKLAL